MKELIMDGVALFVAYYIIGKLIMLIWYIDQAKPDQEIKKEMRMRTWFWPVFLVTDTISLIVGIKEEFTDWLRGNMTTDKYKDEELELKIKHALNLDDNHRRLNLLTGMSDHAWKLFEGYYRANECQHNEKSKYYRNLCSTIDEEKEK